MVSPEKKGEGSRIADQTANPRGQLRATKNDTHYRAEDEMKSEKRGKGDENPPSHAQRDRMGVFR